MDYKLSTQNNYDEYAARHLSYHLHEAGMSDDLYHLVVTKEWYRCSLDFASSGQLYREDIRRAFLLAADQIQSMVHTNNISTIGKYLVRPAVLAWISASLVQAMKRVPSSVVEAMIRLGETDQAIQRAETIHDPFDRAKALIHIGQTMFEVGEHAETNALWNQVQELLLSSPLDFFNEKFEALSQLICARARAGQLEEALSLADKFQTEVDSEEGGVASTTHIALVSAWGSLGKIERILTAARAITNSDDQVTALCGAAGNMLLIDRPGAMKVLDKALGLFPGIKDRKALSNLACVLAEAGRLTDAWRVAGENVDSAQRSRILVAAARGAQQSDNPETVRQWLAEAFRSVLTIEAEEEQLMLLVELARIGHPIVDGNNADRLIALIKNLWKKSGIEKKPQKREEKGTIALGLLALGDIQCAREVVSDSLDWQLPKDDWEENEALSELARVLGELGDIDGLDWVLSRAKQRESPRQQAKLAYHLAKAFTTVGDLPHAKEAEQLMEAAALRIPDARIILMLWREEKQEHPSMQAVVRELLDQTLPQTEKKGDLPDDLIEIALTLAKGKKLQLAGCVLQQSLEAIKQENDPNMLARLIGLIAEVAAILNNDKFMHYLKTTARTIDDEWLQAEALCWIAGWQAVMGRNEDARQTYFQVNNHSHEIWEPVNPADIEAALEAGHMDWVVEIALDIGWPTAKSAAIFAGLAIALERPGPHWIEGALHAIDNIMEGYNSIRTICHRMIIRKITAEPDLLEAALKYWLSALEHNRKRDSGEAWVVIAEALPLFYEQFGRLFARSLWLELAKAHQLLS